MRPSQFHQETTEIKKKLLVDINGKRDQDWLYEVMFVITNVTCIHKLMVISIKGVGP